MNISKDQFVEIINACINQADRDSEIADAIDIIAKDGSNNSIVFSTRLIDKIISALDHDGVISWWFWDGPCCGEKADKYAIYLGDVDDPNTKKFVIHDAGELYDYIVERQV